MPSKTEADKRHREHYAKTTSEADRPQREHAMKYENEIRMSFAEPGSIKVQGELRSANGEITFNLEDIWAKLEFSSAYDRATLQAWEQVWTRLAESCRRQLSGENAACTACDGTGRQFKASGDPKRPIAGTVPCSMCHGSGRKSR